MSYNSNNSGSSQMGGSSVTQEDIEDWLKSMIDDEVNAHKDYAKWARIFDDIGYSQMADKYWEVSQQEQRHALYSIAFATYLGFDVSDQIDPSLFKSISSHK